MNNAAVKRPRVLIVGRSPSALVNAVEILRGQGYVANATNQFDRVLEDYDVGELDLVVFGGMVPPDTKQRLRGEISERNPHVTFLQGLFGIGGVIAAQVQAAASAADVAVAVSYDQVSRSVQVDLGEPSHVTVEAWWATSWTPQEPKSTSRVLLDDRLQSGRHHIVVPDDVPRVASFGTVTSGSTVRVFTIGGPPNDVAGMMPASASDVRLPEVSQIVTKNPDQ
jgi:hypothetical protein